MEPGTSAVKQEKFVNLLAVLDRLHTGQWHRKSVPVSSSTDHDPPHKVCLGVATAVRCRVAPRATLLAQSIRNLALISKRHGVLFILQRVTRGDCILSLNCASRNVSIEAIESWC